jgi:hypothetical protein
MNIQAIRIHLSAAAKQQPEHAPVYKVLSKQFMHFENAPESEKAALRPVIRESLKRIETAR